MLVEKIDKLLREFAVKVECKILEKDYETVSRDEYTIAIKVLGETTHIWDSNDPEDTKCYWVDTKGYGSLYFPEVSFHNPALCREVLREFSPEEEEKRIAGIDAEIELLQKQKEEK